jgi:hypothetical protein
MTDVKKTTVSVRVSDEQLAQIETLAKQFDLDKGDVMRWAIEALKNYVAANKGRLHLPLDFKEVWRETQPRGVTSNPTKS